MNQSISGEFSPWRASGCSRRLISREGQVEIFRIFLFRRFLFSFGKNERLSLFRLICLYLFFALKDHILAAGCGGHFQVGQLAVLHTAFDGGVFRSVEFEAQTS
jgi:hypothetical protein